MSARAPWARKMAVSAHQRKRKERRSGGVARDALGLTPNVIVSPLGRQANRLSYRAVNAPSGPATHCHGVRRPRMKCRGGYLKELPFLSCRSTIGKTTRLPLFRTAAAATLNSSFVN
jgi:hypothetical protein